jgi:tetratricopeptide (TPR) repeat protein
MAKPGRNDPCPCGSGNKYKKCCLAKDRAAQASHGSAMTREELSAAEVRRAAAHVPGIRELTTAIAARLGMSEDDLRRYDQLMDASNAARDLVRAGKLDQAEAAARDLLARFPDEHDGWDRLGTVYEARGQNRQAADCYRKAIEVIRKHGDDDDPEIVDAFTRLVDKLDPAPTG